MVEKKKRKSGQFRAERVCSYCGETVIVHHRKRLVTENCFCNRECEASFRRKVPNTRCIVCGKPMSVKPTRLSRTKGTGVCCCKSCSAKNKASLYKGSSNPNSKHKYDFSDIYNLTHDGAYILGLLYSDGNLCSNSLSISQKGEYSGYLLNKIAERLTGDYHNVSTHGAVDVLNIYSKELVNFILNLGGICLGKKSKNVSLPNIPEDKMWSFICGYFDGDGGFRYDYRYPRISLASNSVKILKQISEFWKVSYNNGSVISASGYKALDICGKMYENTSFRHTRKYEYFEDILNWEPLPNGQWYRDTYFKCKKFSEDAIIPSKERVTDSGYDVYAVDVTYDNKTGLYLADTCLAVEPIPGWYFDLVGRSSLPKTGFMFVGGVGVIDRSYVGSVKMLLKKINDAAVLPQMPFKLGQLIPRKIIHVRFIEVDSLSDTDRGSGGFGSTGD